LPKTISKSPYLAGLQCPKRLWLEIHRYDLKDEVDQDTPAAFSSPTIIRIFPRPSRPPPNG
jgi:hypothetical protein